MMMCGIYVVWYIYHTPCVGIIARDEAKGWGIEDIWIVQNNVNVSQLRLERYDMVCYPVCVVCVCVFLCVLCVCMCTLTSPLFGS